MRTYNSQSSANCARIFFLLAGALLAVISAAAAPSQNLYEGGYWDGRLWPSVENISSIAVNSHGDLVAAGNKIVSFDLSLFAGSGPGDIVRWDGQHWSILATNALGVSVLATRGGDLFAGGQFTTVDGVAAQHVARWNGTNWTAMGEGLGVRPVVVAVETNAVYAASDALAQGDTTYKVWAWDETSWRSLADGFAAPVKGLLATNGLLYAASATHLARWNGESWEVLATATANSAGEHEIRSVAKSGDNLIVAGAFGGINGVNATNVAAFDGTTWAQLGSGIPAGDVHSVSAFGTNVYLCGAFKVLDGGVSTNAAVLTLNSNQWVSSLARISTVTDSLRWRGPDLFALGDINDSVHVRSGAARIIWQFDGQKWAPVQNGLSGIPNVYRLAEVPEGIVIGRIPNSSGSGVLLWDGGRFVPLNTAVATNSGTLTVNHDLAVIDGAAYISGNLRQTNGVTTNVLARLQDGIWRQATAPMGVSVSALAGENGTVYAGGATKNGGAVYEWDGSQWRQLGGAFGVPKAVVNGGISALAIRQGRLYVAGTFNLIGGNPIASLAYWNGQDWVGTGSFDGPANDIAVANEQLYAVGGFTNIDGVTVNGLAVWDGTEWTTMGGGLPGANLNCVAVSEDGLIAVGGKFNGAHGIATTNLLVWRGDHWGGLGSGMFNLDGPPAFMHWQGHDLYVTGSFLSIDGLAEAGFAIWHEGGAVLRARDGGSDSVEISATGATPQNFVIERTKDFSNWLEVETNALGNPGTRWFEPSTNAAGFYRLRSGL